MNVLKTFTKFSIGSWVSAIISLVGTPITAWFLSPAEFGKASMFMLAYGLLTSITGLGLDQSFARFYNDVEDGKRFNLLATVILPCLLMCTGIFFVSFILQNQFSKLLFDSIEYVHLVFFLCIGLFVGTLSRFAYLSIRMQNKAALFSKIQIISAVLSVITLILYVKYINRTFEAIVITFVFTQILTFIITIVFDFETWIHFFRLKFFISKNLLNKCLFYGLPFIPTFLLDWAFQGADRTFLRYYSNYEELGLYAVAFKVSLALGVIQNGFAAFWVPFSLEKYYRDPEEKNTYSIMFNALTFLFGILIITIIIFQDVIKLVLPSSYGRIISIFPFVLFIPMLYSLSEITVVGINFMSKTIYHLYVMIFALSVNILTAYFVVPKMGAIGAAISMFVGYVAFFCIRTYYGRKFYKFSLDIKKFIISFLLILTPVLITVFYKESHLYFIGIISLIVLWFLYRNDLKKLLIL
jgi:O-antigen/teichoic acid export membrane protein